LKDILKKIIQVIGWIVLLGAFASIGFGTENPQLMVPLYFLIFLVLFAVLFIIVRRRKRVVDTRPDKSPLLTKILGAILLLAGILMPYFQRYWLLDRDVHYTHSCYLNLNSDCIHSHQVDQQEQLRPRPYRLCYSYSSLLYAGDIDDATR